MKVGFVAGTLARGGAEKQLTLMLRALQGTGVDIRVLCLTKGEYYEREIKDLGIDLDWIGYSKSRFVRLGSIIRNVQRCPVDVIQSAHFFTNIYVGIAGRILGIPNIGAVRNDLLSEIGANGNFGKWQLKLPQQMVVNSQLAFDRAIAKGIHPSKIEFVRNAVEIRNVENNHDEDQKSVLTILFVGRLVNQKRPELFVELAYELSKRFPEVNLEFIVAGEGPLRSKLEKLADDRGLSKRVLNLVGEECDMASVYRKADILVLTSGHEGTPNVILEAMSYGIPVVATRVGGVPELLSENHGIMVDPNDFGELCAGTSKLIRESSLRQHIGQQAKAYVAEHHSIDSLRERLTNIYSRFPKPGGLGSDD